VEIQVGPLFYKRVSVRGQGAITDTDTRHKTQLAAGSFLFDFPPTRSLKGMVLH
jgi:hypothetical protein